MITIEAFNQLVADHGVTASRTDPAGIVTTGIAGLWEEDRIERTYDEHGERTSRTGIWAVYDTTAYAWGETWTINGDVWQVAHQPFTVASNDSGPGLRILSLRRDDKVRTTTSRGHIL